MAGYLDTQAILLPSPQYATTRPRRLLVAVDTFSRWQSRTADRFLEASRIWWVRTLLVTSSAPKTVQAIDIPAREAVLAGRPDNLTEIISGRRAIGHRCADVT